MIPFHFKDISLRPYQATNRHVCVRSKQLGGLVIGLDKRFGLFGKNVQGLSWIQRIYWFYYPFKSLTLVLTTVSLFTGPFFMLSGVASVVYATNKDLKALAQASALSFICTFLLKCHMALKAGYRSIMLEQCNLIWIAPCKWASTSNGIGTMTDDTGVQTIPSRSFRPLFFQLGSEESC